MNGENVIYVHIDVQWNINQTRNGGNPAICDNMGEPGGRYAQWRKSDTHGHVVYDVTYR